MDLALYCVYQLKLKVSYIGSSGINPTNVSNSVILVTVGKLERNEVNWCVLTLHLDNIEINIGYSNVLKLSVRILYIYEYNQSWLGCGLPPSVTPSTTSKQTLDLSTVKSSLLKKCPFLDES